MQTVPAAAKQLKDILPKSAGDNVTLDLAQVSRCDSAGVALLVEVMQMTNLAEQTLHFSNLPEQMKDIAGLSGLLEILPLASS